MPRNSQLKTAEPPTEDTSALTTQEPQGFIARPNAPTLTVATPQSQAIAIQELEVSFDPDLRLAMIQRLVKAQEEIKSFASQEQQLTKVVELGRLTAVEKARQEGVQLARAEFAAKLKKQKEAQQQQFIKNELPQVINACAVMSESDMKHTVEAFAKQLDIKINWEQTDAGLRCVPVIAGS
ncbi:hypothetical protein LC593_01995 [Nostoc sp. CHAB 5844]|nr:hypothetical protein [Nostoc sp. CHAB 5844]